MAERKEIGLIDYNTQYLMKAPKIFFFIWITSTMFSMNAFAISTDSSRKAEPLKASANILITNNGISVLPNFMLGKPATIVNLSIGKKRFFFEPELRWQLNGNPWAYIFRLKYKANLTKKLSYTLDVRPSYVFRENQVTINGQQENRWITTRNFTVELLPLWKFSNKFEIGGSLLVSKGLDSYGVQKNTYFAIQPKFPKIAINSKYYIGYFPQLFYLTLDKASGYYYSQSVSFNKKDFPIYLTSIFTYKIQSTVIGNTIVWNAGLNIRI